MKAVLAKRGGTGVGSTRTTLPEKPRATTNGGRGSFRGFDGVTVDQVMAEERAGAFAKRSIKTSAKLAGLKIVT